MGGLKPDCLFVGSSRAHKQVETNNILHYETQRRSRGGRRSAPSGDGNEADDCRRVINAGRRASSFTHPGVEETEAKLGTPFLEPRLRLSLSFSLPIPFAAFLRF